MKITECNLCFSLLTGSMIVYVHDRIFVRLLVGLQTNRIWHSASTGPPWFKSIFSMCGRPHPPGTRSCLDTI
jgi:hypothetical protein